MKRISSLCSSQKAAAFPRFTDVENQPPNSKVTVESFMADLRMLHGAAKEGDWGTAELILKRNVDYARQKITKAGETLLHVAVGAKRIEFVQKLVEMLDPIDLELRNDSKRTAFVYAIELGEKKMAEVMVEKNKKLLTINAYEDMTPLEVAALTKQNEMFSYLFKVTPDNKLSELGSPLMEATIQNDMYDMALQILEKDETLATSKLPCYNSFMSVLVRKSPPIIDEHHGGTWGNVLRAAVPAMEEKYLQRKKVGEVFEKICNLWLSLSEEELSGLIMKTEILHYAAMEGNAEFIAMVLRRKPVLSLVLNKKGQTMFHVAVSHRQERVFNLIYEMGPFEELIHQIVDEDGNNILHLTAMLGQTVGDKNVKAKSELFEETQKILPRQLINVSGPALQLQREILWFRDDVYPGGEEGCATNLLQDAKRKRKNPRGALLERAQITNQGRRAMDEGHREFLHDRRHFNRHHGVRGGLHRPRRLRPSLRHPNPHKTHHIHPLRHLRRPRHVLLHHGHHHVPRHPHLPLPKTRLPRRLAGEAADRTHGAVRVDRRDAGGVRGGVLFGV